MKLLSDIALHQAGKVKIFLTLWERTFEHEGKVKPYFMVSRGDKIVPHEEKRPDAVVVVATIDHNNEKKLVMIKEYRIPIGIQELSFPAGLIEDKDYQDGADHELAARKAAIRELKEETGLDLEVLSVSPPNLYSSAGLTNESIIYVFGKATGVPSKNYLETNEVIDTLFVSKKDAETLMNNGGDFAHSKTAFPFLWAFAGNVL